MIDIDAAAYTYPVLGAPGAYVPPHDVFELKEYNISKNDNDMYVSGTLRMGCGLLGQYVRSGLCKAYMLTWSPGKVYRGCRPTGIGDFSHVIKDAAVYADRCNIQCVIAADRDIPEFFHPKYHNAEYGGAPLDVKRGMPLAVSSVVSTKKKAESVGSAITVESDPHLPKDVSFVVECGDGDHYIHIKARPDTKRQIDIMHKTNRALFDNVVFAPVLAHALQRMAEYKQSAQWASVLAEKCESVGISQGDIDERLHVVVQKLLCGNTSLFERLKWGEGSRRVAGDPEPAHDGEDY